MLDRINVLMLNKGYSKRFQDTYSQKKWGKDLETVSGEGSTLERTVTVRQELPQLLKELGVKSMIDAPCGDYYWMKQIDLPVETYRGYDIVQEIIVNNKQRYEKPPQVQFDILDIIAGPLPQADLIMIRDCFIHFSLSHIKSVIRHVKNSGTTWLLSSQSPQTAFNRDIPTGPGCRDVNLLIAPFVLPQPRKTIIEALQDGKTHYELALWHRDELPNF